MNEQQLIKEIEIKITELEVNIKNRETELNNYKSTLLALIEELNKIKQKIEENENMKNNKRSPKGSNNSK